MKAPTDRLHRAELLRSSGIYDSREESLLEALAREDGEASVAALGIVSRLTNSMLAFAALSLANVSTVRNSHHAFVNLSNVDMSTIRSFALNADTQISLTATGWLTVELMGYGRPAILMPECHFYAPVIADLHDPETHRHQMQINHHLTHWTLLPAVPFHEA